MEETIIQLEETLRDKCFLQISENDIFQTESTSSTLESIYFNKLYNSISAEISMLKRIIKQKCEFAVELERQLEISALTETYIVRGITGLQSKITDTCNSIEQKKPNKVKCSQELRNNMHSNEIRNYSHQLRNHSQELGKIIMRKRILFDQNCSSIIYKYKTFRGPLNNSSGAIESYCTENKPTSPTLEDILWLGFEFSFDFGSMIGAFTMPLWAHCLGRFVNICYTAYLH